MCTNDYMGATSNFACGGFVGKTMYSAQYFLNFFSTIPEDKWMEGEFHNMDKTKFCALGFLGGSTAKGRTREGEDLMAILGCNPAAINDGNHSEYRQHHPKYRILAAIEDAIKYGKAKKHQEPSPVEYKSKYYPEYLGGIDYGKIVFEGLPKVEIKEVIKEVIVEKVVEKIVYKTLTVDEKVRELQREVNIHQS